MSESANSSPDEPEVWIKTRPGRFEGPFSPEVARSILDALERERGERRAARRKEQKPSPPEPPPVGVFFAFVRSPRAKPRPDRTRRQ